MNLKRKLFYICLSVCTLMTILCISILEGTTNKNNNNMPRKKIGAIYMTMNNPYFNVIHKEVEAVVTEKGDTIITRDSALDAEMQLRQMEDLIEQDVDVILLNAVDWKGILPGLKKARAAHIPVLAVDAEVYDSEYVEGMITSDNYEAGVIAARDMMKRLPGGNILILIQGNNKSARDRIDGFVETLNQSKWQYKIIDELECSGQLEIAQPLVEEVVKRGEHIDAVMALNDPSALGAMAALDAAGILDDVIVYGVDGAPEAKMMINDSKMTGTIAQSPTETGRMAVQFLYDIMDGKTIKKKTILPVTLITHDNIESFNLSSWE